MYCNPNDAYMENRVVQADPLELVRMLYQGGIAAVRGARQHLAEGDIAARSRSISKACDILLELLTTLDRERGGEVARNLARLYEYMHFRLLEANMQQQDEPLAEVLRLMATLSEAWDGVGRSFEPEKTEANPWDAQPVPYETAPAYESHAWSF